eukprot:c28987_g2_i1 orf=564-2393(+)
MKSSLRKLRDFALSKHASKGKISTVFSEFLQEHGEVIKGMRDVEDMQAQYEGLLTAAQIISSSAFDFSRSLQDMASYMVETFGQIGDGETGHIFSMLGKVQYEVSKLLDLYAANVSQTIINPIEILLNELQHVEDMKGQYDEKRYLYNHLRAQKPKGKIKNGKGDAIDKQLLSAKEELDELAMILGFRLQSFKQGRRLSLITQAVRYHTAQMNLFRKSLASLNVVEPLAAQLAQEHNIDRTLSEDVVVHDHQNDVQDGAFALANGNESESSCSPKSVQVSEAEADKFEESRMLLRKWEGTSKSAPILPALYYQTDFVEKVEEISLDKPVQKYALPSPSVPLARNGKAAVLIPTQPDIPNKAMCPLDVVTNSELYSKQSSEAFQSGIHICSAHNGTLDLKESEHSVDPSKWNQKTDLGVNGVHNLRTSRRYSHSGPLLAQPWVHYKRTSVGNSGLPPHPVDPLYKSGPLSRPPMSRTFVSPRISPSMSPPHLSPPRISELHKLPPPPGTKLISTKTSLVPHSAPLVKQNQDTPPKTGPLSPSPSSPSGIVKRSLSSGHHGKFAEHFNGLEPPAHQKLEAGLLSPRLYPIVLPGTASEFDIPSFTTQNQAG